MANIEKWVMQITLKDGVKRDSSMAFYVPAATAKAYCAAADKAARDATVIGTMFADILACTQMTEVARRVYVEDQTDPVPAVADTILRGNKIVVQASAGGTPLTFTIPGRDPSSYTQDADHLTINIGSAGDFKTLIDAIAANCISVHGDSITVVGAYLND